MDEVKKFISLTWTQDISDGEAKILIYTAAEMITSISKRLGSWLQSQVIPGIKPFGDWVILMMPRGSAYSSVDWYLDHCRTPKGEQLDGPGYLRLIELEPWQSSTPHFDVALTAMDLLDAEGESVLNVALPGLATVASVHHLRRLGSEEAQILGLRHLAAHALGRAVGIPLPSRSEDVIPHGDDLYCNNVCAMRPCTQLRDLLEYGMEGAGESGPFCEACQRDLEAVFVSSHYSPN